MSKLEELRAKLKQQDNSQNAGLDNSLYRHWDIPNDTTAVIRFLPDSNEDNIFFWRERQMIRMPFQGIKGCDVDEEVTLQVPCIDMWHPKTCRITKEIIPWFNGEFDQLARMYWKKRSYIFQGFVQSSPIDEDNPPENPIRRFIIAKQIFKIIHDSLMDDELETIPTDYDEGVDFRIKKTQKTSQNGTYNDYTTSQWARKETSLSEEQLEAIEKYGLNDLNNFLPPKPSEEELDVQWEMFKDSLNGSPYDPFKFGDYYKPFNYHETINEILSNATKSSEAVSENVNSSESDKDNIDDLPWDDPQPKDVTDDSDDSDDSDDETDSNDQPQNTTNASDLLEQLKRRKQQEAN